MIIWSAFEFGVQVMSYTNANVSMKKLNRVGHKSLIWVQDIGLLIIAVSTVVAVGIEIGVMIDNMTVTLARLLQIHRQFGSIPQQLIAIQ